MIEVRNVSKTFKDVLIFENINLSLKKGKIYGFVGHNGSGKSVLFKTIAGFVQPSEGEIFVDEKQIGKDIDFIPDLGVIIETPGFIETYSGFQNLKYLASVKQVIDDQDIIDVLIRVGLNPNDKKIVKKYSMGMRQRLAIAQAFMEDQKVLILDEIFNGLDRDGQDEIKELLLSLKAEDKTLLITSHIAGDIDSLSDEIYEFRRNTLIKQSSAEDEN